MEKIRGTEGWMLDAAAGRKGQTFDLLEKTIYIKTRKLEYKGGRDEKQAQVQDRHFASGLN